MDRDTILAETERFVREELAQDSSGHDWWHIARVRALTRTIAREEGADLFVCELAALLHDLADAKIAGDEATGVRRVSAWLAEQGVEDMIAARVMEIIQTISFAGGGGAPMTTIEGRVVQDADRLDALGAVGIARAFAYGGSRGRLMHDPTVPLERHASKEAYHASAAPTINHFYEKLLLLRDRMNTTFARTLAAERHRYMENFLREFYAEWDGER